MRDSPEIFWFSNQYRYDESSRTLYFRYNFSKKQAEFYKKQIFDALFLGFQFQRLSALSQLEKVTYVYRWLVANTTYNDYSSFNQTIFSVLINRNSVCTGYAKTAQYLLRHLGVESQLVFGRLSVDKTGESRHAWNIVKIDGQWYHVDFCLADPALKHFLAEKESPEEREGVLWNYFCVSTERVKRNRTIEFEQTLPNCTKSISFVKSPQLINPSNCSLVCVSDSGSCSKVYLNPGNKKTVFKALRYKENREILEREYENLKQLAGCNHVVRMTGRRANAIELEQLTPWIQLLQSHYYNPCDQTLLSVFNQLIDGLIECRDRGITYTDIHYNNIFVDRNGKFKWGDFGIAFYTTKDGSLPESMIDQNGNVKGAMWFLAPETINERIFTEASAIYSVAMVFYFILNYMKPPFWVEGNSDSEALKRRIAGEPIPNPKNIGRYVRIKEILEKCLKFDPKERPQRFEDIKSILHLIQETEYKLEFDSETDTFVWKSGDDNTKYIIDSSPKTFYNGVEDSNYSNDGVNNLDSDSFAATDDLPKINDVIGGVDSIMTQEWGDGNSHEIDDFARTSACPLPTKPATSDHTVPKTPKHSFWSKLQSLLSGMFCDDNMCDVADLKEFINDNTATGIKLTDLNRLAVNDAFKSSFYAPKEVQRGEDFIVRVFFHFNSETKAVDSKVKAISPDSSLGDDLIFGFIPKIGDRFRVKLSLNGAESLNGLDKEIIWYGRPADCKFLISTASSISPNVSCSARIYYNDIPVGELVATINLSKISPESQMQAAVNKNQYSKIFISYSHADAQQVRGIAETCRMLGVDYFFDRHSLNPGDVFKDKILHYIENADLFVLCWSKNAAQSEWVQIERKYALHLLEEGKASLALYPLSIAPEAPLPADLADKFSFGSL